MSFSRRILSLIFVLTTLVCCIAFGVSANADTLPTELTAVAGETVEVTFKLTACYSTDGTISYSNINLFDGGVNASGSLDKGMITANKFILDNTTPFAFEVKLSGKIAASATVGSYCDITFNYLRTDSIDNGIPTGPEDLVKTVRVKVIEKAAPPTTTTQAPTTTTKAPTTTTKAPTTTTKPGTTTAALNLTELNNQIGAAQALTSGEYTAQSWANVETALQAAIAARTAKSQGAVDSAANALKDALAALVRVDGSSLQALIDEIKAFLDKDEAGQAHDALMQALAEAESALQSGDQAAIDAAETKVKAAFDAYKAKIDEMTKVETEIKEVEKLVEVEPTSPFCNISLHTLWLILLIISLLLNVLLIAFIVYCYLNWKKKKEAKETDPFTTEKMHDELK